MKPLPIAKPAPRKRSGPRRQGAKVKGAKKLAFADRVFLHSQRLLWLVLEVLALVAIALVAVIAALGQATARFSGVDLWSNLLPFAGVVLLLAAVVFLTFRLWLIIRNPAPVKAAWLPLLMAWALALGCGWLASGEGFRDNLRQLRSLVGGVRQAEITTLAHQVYASYRRTDLAQMQMLLARARPYEEIIYEAAKLYELDAEVMMGLGATESSFLPRDSKDGGRGLFQITAPPQAALAEVVKLVGGQPLDWRDHRHNALIAAATWRHYLREMKGDLFLSLLAYNIGPKNGGLLSIMSQYGAKDFVTIQPYLQNLPRDYPIRVLTAALSCRLYKANGGQLPRYENDDNAKLIQALGIPGLGDGSRENYFMLNRRPQGEALLQKSPGQR